MEKKNPTASKAPQRPGHSWLLTAIFLVGLFIITGVNLIHLPHKHTRRRQHLEAAYGTFPKPNDPFQFMPCTNNTLPPSLNDPNPEVSWSALFDPDPDNWNWGDRSKHRKVQADPYAGRGIYLCGYIDVPLDYTEESDLRIARLAVTKFQVSGLEKINGASPAGAGKKSKRTIIIEPGGPGGSGTGYAWRAAEDVTERFSKGKFDVLGWDPRGVNASLPAISCFPYNADRDRWSLLSNQYREVSPSPMAQLQIADALNEAVFQACWRKYGDLPRFVSTSFVARDMEEIRKALDEDELTGYLVSYGTGIGQTYANMFPDSVGRIIMDGTEYVRDHRVLGGFGWTALDNTTDAWRDGFIGECINAGPKRCALAKSKNGRPVTKKDLERRMGNLLTSLIERPVPAYTEASGPSLVTYSILVQVIYSCMYNARSWPTLAKVLSELEDGFPGRAARYIEDRIWEYDPALPPSPLGPPSSDELGLLVICADSYDAPQPLDGLEWWDSLWANMTRDSWVAGNSRFQSVFPCRNFAKYWPKPAEVYRGDLNNTLRHPVLLIAETYDPATPLRNGRRLLTEMGDNARLIVHHGYGHSSRDTSNCTNEIARTYILEGKLPEHAETNCYANEKPYLYGTVKSSIVPSESEPSVPMVEQRVKHF